MRHAEWSRDALGQQVASPPRGAHGVDLRAIAATGTGWTGWGMWRITPSWIVFVVGKLGLVQMG